MQSGTEFFIADKDYRPICGTNNSYADDIGSFRFDEEKIMQNGVLNGVDMQIISMKSAVSDWKYIYMIPSSLYEYDISKRKITTAISLVSMMLVCFFGLGSISMWLYKPIKRAIMSLKKHFDNTQKISDTEFMNQQISRLITEADEVNRTIAENANMIRSQIVMETVYGTVTEAEFYNRLKLIEKNFDMIHIVPVIVHTDEKLFKQTDAKEHEYVMLRLCEIIDEKYGELCNCICAKISYNSICALVDCREFDTVRKITEAVADCFKQNGVMKFNIYLGRQRESFEYVSDDCRKMIDLKKYEFLYGFGNILTLEQLEKREEHKGNTSASVYSEKLKQYLAAGDFIACKNMAGTLYRECIGSEYCYSYVDGCFLSLLTTAARFARETVGKDDLKNLELMSDDFSTLEDVYERLEQLFELCGSKTRNTEISAEEKLIEQIKRYVLDNIETDVSQSSVAEYFNISSAHLSRVFKKVTDERFSDFVTGAKLDYAAGLLLNEPDTPVVNIAERLGYYSINYFNSLFKKKFYKTPVQYRKSN